MIKIGFAGRAGAGKSTAAGLLASRLNAAGLVVTLDAFAVDVKRGARNSLGWDGLDKSDEWRRILQRIGETGRRGNPAKWVRSCAERLKTAFAVDVVIYTDVRHANEAQFVREGGVLVWVVGRAAELSPAAANHPSEAVDFDHAPDDETIHNGGSFQQLIGEVDALAAKWIPKLMENA